MYPIVHSSSNRVYRGPEGADNIGKMPATVVEDAIYSFWQPSEQDIANILAGVPVRLGVLGKTHPIVSLEVTNSVE